MTIDTSLTDYQTRYLRGYPNAARALLSVTDRRHRADFPPEARRVFTKFREHGLIERENPRTDKELGIFWVPEAVRGYVRELLGEAGDMPCGHTGFSNLRDGAYGCTEPTCEAEFDRAAIEAIHGNSTQEVPADD